MPSLDLGSVVGPQGEQGATGAQGIRGEQGLPGPNQVTNSTATPLTGVLTGNGSVVGVASIDEAPTADSIGFARSGGTNKAIKARMPVYGMGKNLLDNAYFVGGGSQLGDGIFPINQRGRTQYSGSGKHFDRWGFGAAGGEVELLASGAKITVTAGSQSFSQNLGMPAAALYGQTVTVSALTAGGDLYCETGTLPDSAPSSTTTYISKNIPNVGSLSVVYAASSGRFNVNIGNSSSSSQSVVIAAMKLELGSEQTLCHNEGTAENPVWVLNEVPDYGEELRKCQRHLFVIEQFVSSPLAGFGVARNSSIAILQFPTPVTLRKATPTLSYSGTFKLWHGSVTSYDNAPEVTSMTGVGLQSTSVNFGVNVASGLTAGELCMIQMSAGSKIIISVEL